MTAAIVLPDGLRWATGGGIGNIDGCNGRHIARGDIRGTLCGRYGPAIMREPKSGETICKTCAKIAGVPHVVS